MRLAVDGDASAQAVSRPYRSTRSPSAADRRGARLQDYFAARASRCRSLGATSTRSRPHAGLLDEIKRTRPTSSTPGAPRSRWRGRHLRCLRSSRTSPTSRWSSPWSRHRCCEDRPRPQGLAPQRDRRLPRGAHRGADPRHGLLPRSSRSASCYTHRAEFGGGGGRGARSLQALASRDRQAARLMPRKGTAEGAPEMIRELKQANVDWLYCRRFLLGTQAKTVIIPAARRRGADLRLDRAVMETRGAHRPREPLHSIGQSRLQAEQILVHKCRRRRSGGDPHAFSLRCAWTWPRRSSAAAAADVQLRRAAERARPAPATTQ